MRRSHQKLAAPENARRKKGDQGPPNFNDPRLGGRAEEPLKRKASSREKGDKGSASATSRPAGFGSLAAVGSVGRVSGVRSKIKVVVPVPTASRRHDS